MSKSVRRQLPGDSLAALAALVRILGSPSSARDLFAQGEPPRARLKRGLKKPVRPKERRKPLRHS